MNDPKTPAVRPDVDAFLKQLDSLPAVSKEEPRRGRLLFGLDATMSRQPTWDQATQIQSEMFEAAADIGGLDMQIAFFRGQGEFKKSPWLSSGKDLARRMTRVECRGGLTQIERLLNHTLHEAEGYGVDALVFVGDAMEENADHLCACAGELGVQGVRGFFFQEGNASDVAHVYQEMARLSGGAYASFDVNSASQLRELLKAVAAYTAGGEKALKALTTSAAKGLLPQLGDRR